jgi:hypothetical protein
MYQARLHAAAFIALCALMAATGVRAGDPGHGIPQDLKLLCLSPDHILRPSRIMSNGCLISQPLPNVTGGQRLRTRTMSVWYTGGGTTASGTTYWLDLSWAARLKGKVYFWLLAKYSPPKLIQARSYGTQINETEYDCAKGTITVLNSWNYDGSGNAFLAQGTSTVTDLPALGVDILQVQCTVAPANY